MSLIERSVARTSRYEVLFMCLSTGEQLFSIPLPRTPENDAAVIATVQSMVSTMGGASTSGVVELNLSYVEVGTTDQVGGIDFAVTF